jgi:hypothetical protein
VDRFEIEVTVMKTGEFDKEKLIAAFHLFFEACGMTAPDIMVNTMYAAVESQDGRDAVKEHLTTITNQLTQQYVDIARAMRVQTQRAAAYQEKQNG